jgi:hypothetical protein
MAALLVKGPGTGGIERLSLIWQAEAAIYSIN